MSAGVSRIRIARRIVQLSVIAALFIVPSLSRYGNYVASHELDRYVDKWEGTLPGWWMGAIDGTLRALPGGEIERAGTMQRNRDRVLESAKSVRGNVWSAQVGPVSFTDPLAAAESVAASKTVTRVLIAGLIAPVLLTILFGRVFCSWICPMGFLFEMTDKLRSVAKFLEIKPRNARFSHGIKYALLVVGLAGTALFSLPVLAYVYPPAIAAREVHDWTFALFDRAESARFALSTAGLTWMTLALLAIALFEVLVARRWWCRYVCPGGALYSLLGAGRTVRVQLDSEACTGCADCVRTCPMGLDPMHGHMGAECDSCGLCIGVCEDDALAYAPGWKSVAPTKPNDGVSP